MSSWRHCVYYYNIVMLRCIQNIELSFRLRYIEWYRIGNFIIDIFLHIVKVNFVIGGRFLANVNSCSCLLYVVVRPSVSLSVVCNVRAPYSGYWKFRQCFYAIWYLGHLWPFDKNFTEIVSGEPHRRGVKPQRGSQIERFWTFARLYLGNGAR